MHRRTRRFGVLALILTLALVGAACGDSDDEGDDGGGSTEEAARSDACRTLEYEDVEEGGEFVDYAHLSDAGSNTSFDPGAVYTLAEAQITTALFDGLTEVDFTDTCNPEVKGLVAESWDVNDDATEYTFTIKDGLVFSNDEPVLPSSFKTAWERAGSAEFASVYGYLIGYVEGGDQLQEGSVETLDSIVADDENMTLTVTLSGPNADFAQIVSHTFFSPISQEDYERLGNTPAGWGTDGASIGNGPFMLESADAPDSGSVVLVRNDNWAGNIFGDTRAKLDKITFVVTEDVPSAFQAFEAGDGDNATIPEGQYTAAMASYPNTVEYGTLATYYYHFGWDDPQLGGEENLKLRQAISLAIDRQEISDKVYEGTRVVSTGITPPGIPGFEEGLCDYCGTDAEQAKALYDEWVADGGELTSPIQIAFNSGGDHDGVASIIQANLTDVLGIETELNPLGDEYFEEIAQEGACQMCRSGWQADYPSYSNFTLDLFGEVSIGLNNLGRYSDSQFEDLIAQAQAEPDDEARGELYRQAEERLLNETTAAIPLNWYTGTHVYRENVVNYVLNPLALFPWEKIGKQAG